MDDMIEKLFTEYKLYYCVECGKCVAVCPMRDIFRQFDYEISPRGIVKKASFHFEVVHDQAIWFCQECTACTETCPAGVEYAGFMSALRELAIEKGLIEGCSFCEECGQYFITAPTLESMRGVLEAKNLASDYINLCPRCRRYDHLGIKLGTR
jgi:heterodisulfide reductase subunit C